MMKKLLCVTTTLLFTLTVISTQLQAASLATELCNSITTDNKNQLRSLIDTNKIKIKDLFPIARCSGKNLLEVAVKNKSIDTGTFIIRRIVKLDLKANMPLIRNGSKELLDIAKARLE